MSYRFSAAERYAIFTVGRERCWLCGEPVSLLEMEVDHILPESLIGKPELDEALAALGLDQSFDLNSWANWQPSHRTCNREKRDHLFRSTPLIQLKLQQAEQRATKAAKLHDDYASNREISRAINILVAAYETGDLKEGHFDHLSKVGLTVARIHDNNREQDDKGKPLQIAPWLEIVHEDDGWLYLRGPGGMVGIPGTRYRFPPPRIPGTRYRFPPPGSPYFAPSA